MPKGLYISLLLGRALRGKPRSMSSDTVADLVSSLQG